MPFVACHRLRRRITSADSLVRWVFTRFSSLKYLTNLTAPLSNLPCVGHLSGVIMHSLALIISNLSCLQALLCVYWTRASPLSLGRTPPAEELVLSYFSTTSVTHILSPTPAGNSCLVRPSIVPFNMMSCCCSWYTSVRLLS